MINEKNEFDSVLNKGDKGKINRDLILIIASQFCSLIEIFAVRS